MMDKNTLLWIIVVTIGIVVLVVSYRSVTRKHDELTEEEKAEDQAFRF